ncbi:serine/threonine-protein kinase, partial [Roseisolibacter sp. H3M3-2]|uniref:serine/threonine-protein kinase n=1 Tax=Roseisolibacter sp. H3M3-2 TaxID=3031323 RepID=UPI0023DC7A03
MLRPDVPTPPDRWEAVMALLEAALERPAAERAAFVAAAAGDDAALRDEVASLLAMEDGAAGFLETPAALPGDAAPPAPVEGRQVGPYRIVREIGRGGMGTVYLAERDDVGRRVALKLVRGDLAAPDRVARFLVERRVLARLDHPNVARLLDAGVADDGTPWFAMEHVDGAPLDRHCDARGLGLADRLRLVEQVCEAVAYAHRNLVVHRDLKPNNVLVTPDGVVKLLDFGIAKLLDGEGEAGGARTGTGTWFLTPDYAAPEQARGEPVTTATDVYALGVVLYELLTGARPQRVESGPVGTLAPPRPVPRASSAPTDGAAATRALRDQLLLAALTVCEEV